MSQRYKISDAISGVTTSFLNPRGCAEFNLQFYWVMAKPWFHGRPRPAYNLLLTFTWPSSTRRYVGSVDISHHCWPHTVVEGHLNIDHGSSHFIIAWLRKPIETPEAVCLFLRYWSKLWHAHKIDNVNRGKRQDRESAWLATIQMAIGYAQTTPAVALGARRRIRWCQSTAPPFNHWILCCTSLFWESGPGTANRKLPDLKYPQFSAARFLTHKWIRHDRHELQSRGWFRYKSTVANLSSILGPQYYLVLCLVIWSQSWAKIFWWRGLSDRLVFDEK